MLDSYQQALKENKNEQKILETAVQNKNDIIAELNNNLANLKKEKENSISEETDRKSIMSELEESIEKIKNPPKAKNNFEDLSQMLETKAQRIVELEDALRESIQLSTEREMVLQEEENRRRQILEKVSYVFSFYQVEKI